MDRRRPQSAGSMAQSCSAQQVAAQRDRWSKRQARIAKRLTSTPACQWSKVDVENWVTAIGMAQYRPRFVHDAVDGALLLQLDINSLRVDLRIAPLGHRLAIMTAVGKLGSEGNGLTDAMLERIRTQRPSSAMPRARSRRVSADPRKARAEREKRRLESVPVAEWSAADVEAWVVSIGYGQYAQNFARNAVDGRLLLQLDADVLRAELRIVPLGHRHDIMAALDRLHSIDAQSRAQQQRQLRDSLRLSAHSCCSCVLAANAHRHNSCWPGHVVHSMCSPAMVSYTVLCNASWPACILHCAGAGVIRCTKLWPACRWARQGAQTRKRSPYCTTQELCTAYQCRPGEWKICVRLYAQFYAWAPKTGL